MAENKSKKSIGTILFALVFGAVGFGVLLFSVIPSLYEGVKMSDWPETQATVSSSEFIVTPETVPPMRPPDVIATVSRAMTTLAVGWVSVVVPIILGTGISAWLAG